MKKHEHAAKNGPETKPAHDEVAKKAYVSLQKNPYSRRDKELRVDRPNVAGTLISSSSFGFGAVK